MRDLVIRGGTVVTPENVRKADVAIEGGLIRAIEPELSGAAEEINAEGLFLFPGLIDVHVHIAEQLAARIAPRWPQVAGHCSVICRSTRFLARLMLVTSIRNGRLSRPHR